jgi:hypothetical protein
MQVGGTYLPVSDEPSASGHSAQQALMQRYGSLD